MPAEITILHDLTQSEKDTALIWQIAENVLKLRDVPVEDLVPLRYGDSNAYMTLHAAYRALENKLYEMSIYMKAQRMTRELIESGRVNP